MFPLFTSELQMVQSFAISRHMATNDKGIRCSEVCLWLWTWYLIFITYIIFIKLYIYIISMLAASFTCADLCCTIVMLPADLLLPDIAIWHVTFDQNHLTRTCKLSVSMSAKCLKYVNCQHASGNICHPSSQDSLDNNKVKSWCPRLVIWLELGTVENLLRSQCRGIVQPVSNLWKNSVWNKVDKYKQYKPISLQSYLEHVRLNLMARQVSQSQAKQVGACDIELMAKTNVTVTSKTTTPHNWWQPERKNTFDTSLDPVNTWIKSTSKVPTEEVQKRHKIITDLHWTSITQRRCLSLRPPLHRRVPNLGQG